VNTTLQIQRNVTIEAADGMRVVLDGQDARQVMSITAGMVQLSRLIITRGWCNIITGDGQHGTPVTLGTSGGLSIDSGTVELNFCDIHGNEAAYGGGGLHNNSASYGGGLTVWGGTVMLELCEIYENIVDHVRDGYHYYDAPKRCNGVGVLAKGGGVYVADYSLCQVTFLYCNLSNNQAQGDFIYSADGGGLSIEGGTVFLNNSNVYNNQAQGGRGGGLEIVGGTATLHSCEMHNNSCELYNVPGLYNELATTRGGAALYVGAAALMHISKTSFQGNLGRPTIRNSGKIYWTCQLGYYKQQTGDYGTGRSVKSFLCKMRLRETWRERQHCHVRDPWYIDLPDFDTCNTTPCREGFYGNTPDETVETCSGICYKGHYCEKTWTGAQSKGTVTPTPCPAGRYFPGVGSSSRDFCIACNPGQYQNLTGQAICKACSSGSYAAAFKSTACESCPNGGYCPEPAASSLVLAFTPCPSGTYNEKQGSSSADACIKCPAGTYGRLARQNSSSACENCAPGSFTSQEGRDECTQCAASTYQNESGALSCKRCKEGSFCPRGSSLELQATCKPGTYANKSDVSGMPACFECPRGFQCLGGATQPIACGAGLISPERGSSYCVECKPGSIAKTAGLSACEPCDQGDYQPNQGMAECRPCTEGTSSGRGATRCDWCDQDYFLPYNTSKCTPCAELLGVTCRWNSTTATLDVSRSYWRQSTLTARAYPCLERGTWTPCIGSSSEADEGCAESHSGPKCEICPTDQYLKYVDGHCHSCTKAWANFRRWWALGLALPTALWLVHITIGRHRNWLASRWIARSWLWLASTWRYIGMQPKLKLLVAFGQVVAAVPSVYDASLPNGKYALWVRALEWPHFVSSISWAVPLPCVYGGYMAVLLISSFWPLVLILLVLLGSGLRSCGLLLGARVAEHPSLVLRTFCIKTAQESLPPALWITFLVVTSVSSRILNTFLCEEFADDDLTGSVKAYLHDDYRLDCASAEYVRVKAWAFALISIWPIGVPLLYTALLITCRRSIAHRKPGTLLRATRFLWSDYKPGLYWWEAIDLARKLTLTGFVVLIDEQHRAYRTLVALLLSLCFLVVQPILKPFQAAFNNWLAFIMRAAETLIFLAVLLFNLCGETCATFVRGDSLVLFFLVVSSAILLCTLLSLLYLLVQEYTATTGLLHLHSTGAPPQLTLSEDIVYHGFVSHTWGSGQDQAAVIKRQLQLCLRGVRIFLDVDDLTDIGLLEQYIQQTACLIFFLSAGYFASYNCLREARACVTYSKPIALVHEADPNKGGLTLADVHRECPSELSAYVFDGREIIRWHRIAEYQHVSLKMIAQHMLLACPGLSKARLAAGLYFRKELVCSALDFPRAVPLVVSAHNPGAHAVARELCDTFIAVTLAASVDEQERATSLEAFIASRSFCAFFFLLYLNENTYCGGEAAHLTEQLRNMHDHDAARILMVHENDDARGACAFRICMDRTPEDLKTSGLYKPIAIAFPSPPHRAVGLALAAKQLGAKVFSLPQRVSAGVTLFIPATRQSAAEFSLSQWAKLRRWLRRRRGVVAVFPPPLVVEMTSN